MDDDDGRRGTKVLHVITGLEVGGAETMLARLAEAMRPFGFAPEVLSMLPPGPIAARLAEAGVPVRSLGMRQGSLSAAAGLRLTRLARRLAPDLVQGWMYHGNLAASWLARSSPKHPPVIWNVRHSLHEIGREKRLSQLVIRLGAALSAGPAAIVYNSRVSARQHEALGFAAARTVVIPNGFDCARLRPRQEAGSALRRRLGLAPETRLVGMVARSHPMKDAPNLLRAVARLREALPEVRLVLIGRGFAPDEPAAVAAVAAAGLGAVTALLGQRDDVEELIPGLDVLALPSAWGEGFPNVLGEAMASGVPCVATDVGDSAWVVGGHGLIVPPRDSEALAAALRRLLDLDPEARARLGQAARERIVARFSLGEVARRYADLYRGVAGRPAIRRAA